MSDHARFAHDCEGCQFLGHFFDHDVYLCVTVGDVMGGSVIARFGSEGHQYASVPRAHLVSNITENGNIGGGMGTAEPWRLRYQDYLFSPQVAPYAKAMVLGLALHALKAPTHAR